MRKKSNINMRLNRSNSVTIKQLITGDERLLEGIGNTGHRSLMLYIYNFQHPFTLTVIAVTLYPHYS